MTQPTLVGLCGSLRGASLNRKLMLEAAALFGGSFTEADLRLPLYDGDLEAAGMPEAVQRLGALVGSADALVIACPEYNKAPPGVLKNALDWLSRLPDKPLACKPVAIVSATGGRAGGERAQTMLRSMLVPLRSETLTWPEVLVGGAADHFDGERLVTESYRAALGTLMERLRAAV
ncbi:MAG: NAD(P)H-dependent oxidoreductase [Paracoccaceae bacterium]